MVKGKTGKVKEKGAERGKINAYEEMKRNLTEVKRLKGKGRISKEYLIKGGQEQENKG